MDLFGWTNVTKCYKNVTECHIKVKKMFMCPNVYKNVKKCITTCTLNVT